MSRPLSQLLYSKIQTGQGSPRIITLHKDNQRANGVREYGLAASSSALVIGLESYKGVYIGRDIIGYTWFIGPMDAPSPIYFGDALAEIERFLWDEIDRQGPGEAELPFLLGVEQGAIMALAAAAAVPDLLSGVIAIDATLPIVPGWSPPLAPLDNLPVLLIDTPATPSPSSKVLAGTTLVSTFDEWGADVTRQELRSGAVPGDVMSAWVAGQPVRHRRSS
jgi:hypothetical protein